MQHQGAKFRELIQKSNPLQVVGTINAYSAMLAKEAGCEAIYLSGAGVANASLGLPDLALTSLNDVLEDASRITDACDLPLLVDIDTGFGNQFSIARSVRLLERANVAAIQIEDQVLEKRCGHRPGKHIVSIEEMQNRIKAAIDARLAADFVIVARTDAYAIEGLSGVITRALSYQEVGADVIFLEALPDLETYTKVHKACSLPILANCTEFGKTPLFTKEQYQKAKVKVILYPLSAFRAMAFAASAVYNSIVTQGTQADLLAKMQTRDELYKILHYLDYENKLK
ncbi:MAG: methylisocitrate lyase [Legionellales bacterium RIFCSPHIGHO2_12_FULL_37_14]|nr:MAG: methylisocitrate lyase [Legionellales bacterium RIFCSPHIGHO2_12_FULL_37_14]